MTTFILHGGFASHNNAENDSFFQEIVKSAPQSPTILGVYFSRARDEVEQKHETVINQFKRNGLDNGGHFIIANEQDFLEQIKASDIIYMYGGKTLKLLEALKEYPDLKNSIAGRVVAGESAGAYVLSKSFYSKTEQGKFSGLGLVPVNTICHYVGDNAGKFSDDPETELLLLPDYKYKVYNI